jgi:hypothetical protein
MIRNLGHAPKIYGSDCTLPYGVPEQAVHHLRNYIEHGDPLMCFITCLDRNQFDNDGHSDCCEHEVAAQNDPVKKQLLLELNALARDAGVDNRPRSSGRKR